jgi:outer membrane protein assembly factor BamB
MKKIAFVICLLAGMTACSLFRSPVASYPTGVIFPLIKAHAFSFSGEISGPLLNRSDQIYFATLKGRITCVSAQTREQIWTYEMAEKEPAHISLGQESVYIWNSAASVHCLDPAGTLKWKTSLSESLSRGACEGQALLFLSTTDGLVLALDKGDGKEAWRFQVDQGINSELLYAAGNLVFGCEDGNVYFLNSRGSLKGRFASGGAVRGGLWSDGKYVYFGSLDYYFYCVDLKSRNRKWRARSGGPIESIPTADSRRIYFVSSNNVMYCLARKSGTVLWWNHVPARSRFRPEIIEDRITASSLSSKLICFDVQTGEKYGGFEAAQELQSNPIWYAPFLIVAHIDRDNDESRLVFLAKEVKVAVSFSKPGPQLPNEEIVVKAETSGFFKPEFEFYLTPMLWLRFGFSEHLPIVLEEDRKLVQEKSEKDSWAWFPEEAGFYVLEIKAVDEKESAVSRAMYRIKKGEKNETG